MFLVPFRSPTSSRGPLPIFRNSFFGHPGSPASQSNSGRPPPETCPHPGPPPRVARLAHPRSLLVALASPVCFLPAGPASVRSWRGGPAPARKLESFVLAPRPARGGVGMGGSAGEASGGPGPGSGPGSRLLSAFPPELGLRAPGGVQNCSCFGPHGPERLLGPHLCGSWARCTLGLGEDQQQALDLGQCSAPDSAPFATQPQFAPP